MQTKPRSRLARLMLATLAGSIALGGAAATVARAETGGTDAATLQALGAAKLTLADAIRTAEAAGQGMASGAAFRIKDGKSVFEVTTQTGTAETQQLIDPATGAILASTPKVEDGEGEGEGEGQGGGQGDQGAQSGEASEFAAMQGAKVNLLKAITSAEGQGGKALAAEYRMEGGTPAIEVELADASGKAVELRIDPATGTATPAGGEKGQENGDEGGDEGHGDGEENEGHGGGEGQEG